MNIRRHFSDYNFVADTDTGVTFRWGKTLLENPRCAPWPELADISISNSCSKGCSFCYRDSTPSGSCISFADYRYIIKELTHPEFGSVFQVALGGGEPLEHPDFIDIIDYTRKSGIIPNFTTNGEYLTGTVAEAISGKVGAVALSVTSFDSPVLEKAVLLSRYGIKCNLHFIVNKESAVMAGDFLKGIYDSRLKDVNAVIFLTYKSTGRAPKDLCLHTGEDLDKFVGLISSPVTTIRFGFDACFVPLLLRQTTINPVWIDSCECAFFSVYIDEQMNVSPCSFTPDARYGFNLKEYPFQYIWNQGFRDYRECAENSSCRHQCEKKELCRGSCLFFSELQLCSQHA